MGGSFHFVFCFHVYQRKYHPKAKKDGGWTDDDAFFGGPTGTFFLGPELSHVAETPRADPLDRW